MIINNKPWLDIFLTINGRDIVNEIFDFGDAFISDILIPKNNDFWNDVFTSWLYVMKNTENEMYAKNNFLNVPVWFNSNIRINNNSVFYKKWYQNGVKNVGDFLSNEGNFLTKNMFQQKFNISRICIMQYNSIITAISSFLKCMSLNKNVVESRYGPYLPFYFENILLNEKCTKVIYNCINKNNIVPTSIYKWNEELSPHGLENICIQDVFKICFKITMDSSLQWLQYRILHRILPVCYYLKKIKIKTDDCCRFCGNEIETILHMFVMCEKILPLWRNFSMHIYTTTSNRVGFNITNIILGETPLNVNNKVINFIILCCKQYIFSCLLQSRIPNMCGLLSHLRMKYYIERCVAIHNSKLLIFDNQWLLWKNIFEQN